MLKLYITNQLNQPINLIDLINLIEPITQTTANIQQSNQLTYQLNQPIN